MVYGVACHDLNLGDKGRDSFRSSQRRHDKWKQKRDESSGYADANHAFRYQGSADVNLYKLFLEQAHALLADSGRLGLIVPSGLYSDDGSTNLRELFLEQCSWEWLFSFTNTQSDGIKVFDIHPSYKFNPVIVAKGGQTAAIRTAFMRRSLADWERAEQFATDYSREQVIQFSPNSRAILEIQSQRDLEVLTKIYANSVLLCDQSERGWGIQYAREFDMTNDSKLFPPRPKWEEWGYRPDEYSRWIKGEWKPIEQLYAELGVQPLPDGQRCCAQPPYDKLPIPRADIPAGIILSREATHFIREDEIPVVTFTDASGRPLKIKIENADGEKEEIEVAGPAIAAPLYQGVMMNQLIANRAHHAVVSPSKWTVLQEFSSVVRPKYLVGQPTAILHEARCLRPKYVLRTIARTTDTRTIIGTPAFGLPAGNSVSVLSLGEQGLGIWALGGYLSSFVYDWQMRRRIAGTNVNLFFLLESAVPEKSPYSDVLAFQSLSAAAPSWLLADIWLRLLSRRKEISLKPVSAMWAIKAANRAAVLAAANAVAAASYGVTIEAFHGIFNECDFPCEYLRSRSSELDLVGFWRVDKAKYPEHRHTVLSLVAFHDLQEKIAACGGDVAAGIEAFCNQNDGEGWMLPETLRLADYGLGHDDRAQHPQPVRECFGPRFYDWQLAQSPEESWRECHLHARNLLGEEGYSRLLAEIEGREEPAAPAKVPQAGADGTPAPGLLFDPAEQTPLFGGERGGGN